MMMTRQLTIINGQMAVTTAASYCIVDTVFDTSICQYAFSLTKMIVEASKCIYASFSLVEVSKYV